MGTARRRNGKQAEARIGAGRFHLLPIGGFFVGVSGFSLLILWWARLGLNQRPLPCEDSALPLSYAPAWVARSGTRGI
jgi:hypothetical protein